MTRTTNIISGSYLNASGQLLKSPGAFFDNFRDAGAGAGTAVRFLAMAGLLHTAAGLMVARPVQPLVFAAITFANAMGMVLFSGIVGYIVMGMFLGRKIPFPRLFSVYAFASGTTLLFSWIPFFLWLTEPWKWWLVYTGLTKGCGFPKKEGLLMVLLSVCVMLTFFYSLMAILQP